MTILNILGLVTAEAHSKVETERDGLKRDLLAERLKFKNAARDLAALAEENEALKPRATKWDDYLKRSRDRRANKPAKVVPIKAARR